MKFDPPLQSGKLIRRYKRFLADVQTGHDEPFTIHCPNTGSMKNCTIAGASVLFSDSGNPKRKYRYTWEAVQVAHGHWAGINTARTNKLVEEAVRAGRIAELSPEDGVEREVKFLDSRFDLALGARVDPHTFIEVKNVTLGPAEDEPDDGVVAFPDAVTQRGQKHLRTLMEVVSTGKRAVLFFCVQHTGAKRVRPADEIDPVYGELLREAARAGVEVIAWKTAISALEFDLDKPVPVDL